ncbi:MAG: TIGR01212 family radical SAM protein [Nitrospiraceae bacterium]|nr:TIGR01212 family radical SAM protein [Nitrospiraceae bacterium]
MRRYNSFSSFARDHWDGRRLQKVNIDAGFTCPNRDGTLGHGGCIYCNNDSFRPSSCKPTLSITEQVENGINYLKKRYKAELFLAYFQPFTNTYAPVDVLERSYREALKNPAVMGLAIGTRPDCVDEEKIALLEEIARTHFVLVEYGLQSVYEKSLDFIERGHGLRTFLDAVELTKGRGIHIGAHIIAGFPTETAGETLAMAGSVSAMDIGFLKLHQLQIVKDTRLAAYYAEHPFKVFSYGEYVDFAVSFLERLRGDIVIQRLFATCPDDILIAPQWGADRYRILRDIENRLAERDTFQGSKCSALPGQTAQGRFKAAS